jgi:hypothetical protein
MPIKWTKRFGVAGATETVQIRDGRGDALTTPPGNFTGSETFACTIWPGDDRTATTTLPAAWLSYEDGTVDVTFPLATMQALAVGFYQWELKLSDGSVDCAVGTLDVTSGPGSGTAPSAYHTYADLVNELPWVGELRDYLQDQSGFAEVSQDAYDWINAAILKAVPVGGVGIISRQNFWWWSTPASSGTSPPLGEDAVIAGYLDDGKLITTTATGKRFVRASVYYTLGMILGRAIGMNTSQNVNALSGQYLRMAHEMLAKCTAEIDIDDDDVADYVIPLSVTNTRFG